MMPPVAGFCPACGQSTLFLGTGGHVTCSWLACSRPSAADEILADHEHGHIVDLDHFDFSMIHPLVERLDQGLLECELAKYMRSLVGPPVAPGRYRVTPDADGWSWEALG